MPTYEFECPHGHRFEKFFRKMAEAPMELACPECATVATRRISGGAGLVFKGSGFYITDYRKGGKGPGAAEAPASAEGAGAEKGGDAKPEGTPAEKKTTSTE